MRLYLAAPLFSSAEREFNAALARCLRDAGHEVFLPQEHQPEGARAIFLSDVRGVDWAEAVVALCDGADPDSGTAWECGYAYLRKPVLLVRTDWRVSGDHGSEVVNLMLTQSARKVLHLPGATTFNVSCLVVLEIEQWT